MRTDYPNPYFGHSEQAEACYGLRSMSELLAHADKLHALRMVDRCASLREAAAQLGIAPSSLSEKLRALESALGVALLARSKGHITLSPIARELLLKASPALDILDELGQQYARGDAPVMLRVGAYESLAVHLLPKVLASLGAKYPNTRLSLRSARSATLARSVLVGELDCAVVVGPTTIDGLYATQLFREHLGVFYTDQVGATAAAQGISVGAWAGLAADRTELPKFYQEFCEKFGIRQLPKLTADSFEALRELALAAGLPVVLPRLVANLSNPALRELPASTSCRTAGAHDIQLLRRRNLGSPLITQLGTLIKQARV
jgi:DNA-binding transcriptional LysR family regulator